MIQLMMARLLALGVFAIGSIAGFSWMNQGTKNRLEMGIEAETWFLSDEKILAKPSADSLDYYFIHGEKSQTLDFSQIFIPTSEFSGEVLNAAEGPIAKPDGEVLTEFFALRLKTQLRLGYFNRPGDYQLALLSDDGSRMYMISDMGHREIVVNNEGAHPTHLECSVQTYYLDENSVMPVEVEYYQGRGPHLSLILLWRRVDDYNTYDPLCGFPEEGHSDWFGPYYTDQENFLFGDLKKRGWQVVPKESFLRPSSDWEEI